MTPLAYIRCLLSSGLRQDGADEVIVGGFVSLMVLCVLSAIDLLTWHGSFSPLNFGGGAASILGAMGAGVGLRNKLSNGYIPPPPPGHPVPELSTNVTPKP